MKNNRHAISKVSEYKPKFVWPELNNMKVYLTELYSLALLSNKSKKVDKAAHYCHQILAITSKSDLEDFHLEYRTGKLLGIAYVKGHKNLLAEKYLNYSLDIYTKNKLSHPEEQAELHKQFGTLELSKSNFSSAQKHLHDSLAAYQTLNV